MYKVLILSREGDAARSYLRQTKGGRAVSLNGEYQFYVNEEIDEPDFLFVRGKAFKNPYTLRVAPQNIFCAPLSQRLLPAVCHCAHMPTEPPHGQ